MGLPGGAELLLDLALSTHGPCAEPFVVDSREAAAAAAVDLREPKHLLIRACLLAAKATAATCRGLIGAQLHVTHSRQGGLQALLKLIIDCLELEENDGEKSVCRDPPQLAVQAHWPNGASHESSRQHSASCACSPSLHLSRECSDLC